MKHFVVLHKLSFPVSLKLDYILCCYSIARRGWKHNFSVHGKWEKACKRFYSPSKRKISCMFLFNTNFCGPTFCLSTDCRLWCKWVSARKEKRLIHQQRHNTTMSVLYPQRRAMSVITTRFWTKKVNVVSLYTTIQWLT